MLKLLDKGFKPVTNNGIIFYWSKNGCVFAGDPVSAFIGGGLGLVGSIIGSRGAERAAETQTEAFSEQGAAQLQISREQLAATQPLRDLALQQAQFQFGQQQQLLPEQVRSQLQLLPAFTGATLGALPLLTQDINRPPGTSAFFQRALSQQTRNIISNLAPFGLTDSSVAGRAIGEGTAALTAQDIEASRNARFRLAGFGQGLGAPSTPSFFGGATAGLGTAAALQQGAAQSQFGAGQAQAAGQFGSAQAFAQPLLQLGGFGLGGGFNSLFQGTGTPVRTGVGTGGPFGFGSPSDVASKVPSSIFNLGPLQ